MIDEIPEELRRRLQETINKCQQAIEDFNESMRQGLPPMDIEAIRIWLYEMRQVDAAIERGDTTGLQEKLESILFRKD